MMSTSSSDTLKRERAAGRRDARRERAYGLVPAEEAEARAVARDRNGDALGAAYWIGYAGQVREWQTAPVVAS